MNLLHQIWGSLQRQLFPSLQEELGPLTEADHKFVQVLSLLRLDPLLQRYQAIGKGRPPHSRRSLACAFLAKSVYQFPTTAALIEALHARKTLRRFCGYETPGDLPNESTFSRAFAQFAQTELPQQLHAALIEDHWGQKLAGHVSRDATAIEAREKAQYPPASVELPPPPQKRGRPKKGEVRPPPPPKRLELQLTRSLAENLTDLPRRCNIGSKKNSKGFHETWRGYKLHLDCIDGDIPVSAILTSASLHDSQAAIPLAQMTAARICSLYDLMDAAYDAPQIWAYSRQLGHVPIIDRNPRGGERVEMDPAQAARFGERSTAERVNSNFKDNYGGHTVRVRGAEKVMAHCMFGIVALTAMQLFRLLG
jgi:hypothetical protein